MKNKNLLFAVFVILLIFFICWLIPVKNIFNISKGMEENISSLASQPKTTPSQIQQKTDDRFQKIDDPLPSKSANYNEISDAQGLSSLKTKGQRDIYNLLSNNVYTISKQKINGNYIIQEITLHSAEAGEADARVALCAFGIDNPQIFWLSNMFDYSVSDDMVHLNMISYISPLECEQDIKTLNAVANKYISSVPDGLGEYERELYLHDKLIANCDYPSDSQLKENRWQPFTVYGALVEKKAVCQGYAAAIQWLLSYVAIDSSIVGGTSHGELHAWNAVKINGLWYYLDPTWDDTKKTQYNHDYFNISEKVLSVDHTLSKPFYKFTDNQLCGANNTSACDFNLMTFTCNSLADNYFTHVAVTINGFDSVNNANVVYKLTEAAKSNQTHFYLKIDSGLDYDKAVSKLFDSSPYWYYNYCKQANKLLPDGEQIDLDDIYVTRSSEYKKLNLVEIDLSFR
ncbi:MAG: transglutaminase domain-containing protein [Bacillota bacterium]|nr:transglutaminase domain-containing protein [Bacillota bacterium]